MPEIMREGTIEHIPTDAVPHELFDVQRTALPDDEKPRPAKALAEANNNNARKNAAPNLLTDLLSTEATKWMRRARCIRPDVDPSIFFPSGRETPAVKNARVEEAQKFCGECAVKQACAEYGIKLHKQSNGIPGIFGGLDEPERRKLINERA